MSRVPPTSTPNSIKRQWPPLPQNQIIILWWTIKLSTAAKNQEVEREREIHFVQWCPSMGIIQCVNCRRQVKRRGHLIHGRRILPEFLESWSSNILMRCLCFGWPHRSSEASLNHSEARPLCPVADSVQSISIVTGCGGVHDHGSYVAPIMISQLTWPTRQPDQKEAATARRKTMRLATLEEKFHVNQARPEKKERAKTRFGVSWTIRQSSHFYLEEEDKINELHGWIDGDLDSMVVSQYITINQSVIGLTNKEKTAFKLSEVKIGNVYN